MFHVTETPSGSKQSEGFPNKCWKQTSVVRREMWNTHSQQRPVSQDLQQATAAALDLKPHGKTARKSSDRYSLSRHAEIMKDPNGQSPSTSRGTLLSSHQNQRVRLMKVDKKHAIENISGHKEARNPYEALAARRRWNDDCEQQKDGLMFTT